MNRNFSILFFAALFGVLGEGIFGLTAIVIAMEETDSILGIGKMLVLTLLPSMFLAPFIGVMIDKYSKRSIMVICYLLRFVVMAVIPISYYFGLFTSNIFYLSIICSYIVWYILEPTKESILKEILPDKLFHQGISIVQGAWQVGLLSSAIAAGVLIDHFGVHGAELAAASTYLAGAFLFYFMSDSSKLDHEVVPENVKAYAHEFMIGWHYLIANRSAFYFVLTTSMTLPFFYGINSLIAPFNYQSLEGTGITLGFIDSGAGIGSLASAWFCSFLVGKRNSAKLLFASIILLAVSTLLFSFAKVVSIAFILYLIIGFFIGNMKVISRIYVFENVGQEYIGRIMTTISFFSLIFSMVMSLIVSFLAERSLLYGYLMVAGSLLIPLLLLLKEQKQSTWRESACEKATIIS
ncbi:MFS transporter [Bacillus sp. JJ1609]